MSNYLEKKPSIVVLAAGLGSRYGSLKQIDQFGPSGETIIDYSIYDAIRAGFKKVVFIIRKNIEEEFKEVFVGKFSDLIEIDYAFQEIDIVPNGIIVPDERVKPWGTGHAVLMAAEKINTPFAVINADDFYGAQSFHLLFDHLNGLNIQELNACLIGYRLKNTLSDHGYVSRGVCTLSSGNYLEEVTERLHIYKEKGNKIYFIENDEKFPLTGEE
ncbi:MAG: nucleotidyltransferase, partial [Cyclobacteriaceae bacterium]|nr:nucleotidyltransferase [Cyclobacteriaceae bacterium]